MNKRRGISLTEVVVVAAILSVLAALLSPVLKSARRQARIGASQLNMKQLVAALNLYRSELGDEGGASEIGLPPGISPLLRAKSITLEMTRTGGTPIPGARVAVYTYMFPGEGPLGSLEQLKSWREHLVATDSNPVLIVDPTHNDCPDCAFVTKLGLGAFLDGSVRRRTSRGSLTVLSAWE
ncbi:MAG: type II secretion system protein [Fimbriimonadaceae bacterium]